MKAVTRDPLGTVEYFRMSQNKVGNFVEGDIKLVNDSSLRLAYY